MSDTKKVYTDTIYTLYTCDAWNSRDSMRAIGATTDKESMYALVAKEVMEGNMDFQGATGTLGLAAFRDAYNTGKLYFDDLQFGHVEEYENLMVKDNAYPNITNAYDVLTDDKTFEHYLISEGVEADEDSQEM